MEIEDFSKNIYLKQINDEHNRIMFTYDIEAMEKDLKELKSRINKATKFVESMEYCGQEDYFYDEQADDPCGNDNIFDESKVKLLKILEGENE